MVLLAAFFVLRDRQPAEMAFDPRVWRVQNDIRKPTDPRRLMVADLMRTRLKAGARWSDIKALLGEPEPMFEEPREYIRDIYGRAEPADAQFYRYLLVDDPPFPQSYESDLWVVVRKGVVIDVWADEDS